MELSTVASAAFNGHSAAALPVSVGVRTKTKTMMKTRMTSGLISSQSSELNSESIAAI